MAWLQSQTKLFRALLYFYPAEFRHECGEEMQHLFAGRLAHEPHWRLWLDTLADLTLTAPKEHATILASDLKHEVRALRAIPGFTAIVLLVTALGIGAAVAVFSVVNAVLLRSLPYSHPESLVYLFTPNVNLKGIPDELTPSAPDVYEWQRFSQTIASFGMFTQPRVHLIQRTSATPIGAAAVSADFFRTLGVNAVLGRTLNATDDQPGHELVAVISHQLWRSQLNARPDILGVHLELNRKTYTVVGVMPPDFGYPFDGDVPMESTGFRQTDVWFPLAYTASQRTNREVFESPNTIARLKPGRTAAAAQAELRILESRLNSLYSPMWRGWTVLARPIAETILGPVRQMLWILLGVVSLVLLIAIGNVAGLLLARTTSRAHELGIRSALGAERARIVRQLLTESLLLSCAGGVLGIALAYTLVRLILTLNPGEIPRFENASVDIPALLVALSLSIGTGLAAGLMPAISASNPDTNGVLKRSGTRTASADHRSRFALIVFEVSLSVVLLTGAGLLIRSYLHLRAVNPGFSPSVLTFKLELDEKYPTPQSRTAFQKTFLSKLQSAPGLTLAGASTGIPLLGETITQVEVEHRGLLPELVENFAITPEYRQALGVPLLRGRDFTSADIKDKNILVNSAFVHAYLNDRDPIGAHIRMGIGITSQNTNPWLTIIGVVGDAHQLALTQQPKPALLQCTSVGDGFAVRSRLTAQQATSQIRSILRSLDPALTLDIKTMRERITESNARRTFQTTLLTGFAIIAVILALVGLYGLMSYTVKQRTAEIGIRLAIGSPRTGILALILSQGMRLTVYGIIIGLAASFALTRLINSWLFETQPTDPLTFTLVPLSILAVAFAACFFPAWSATRIDPMRTLRQE